MTKPNASPIRVIEEMPGYWRAIFDFPPFNVVDGDVFQALQDLLVRMETIVTRTNVSIRMGKPVGPIALMTFPSASQESGAACAA